MFKSKQYLVLVLSLIFIQAGAIWASPTPEEELFVAVQNNDLARVEQLLNNGVDVNSRNSYDSTPLMMAAFSDDRLSVARLLIDRGADVNAISREGGTALTHACDFGAYNIVELLISSGADVNLHLQSSPYGWTPLTAAIGLGGYERIVRLLLIRGADVNLALRWSGDTPLMLAARDGFADIAATLLDGGADMNRQNNDGQTALMIAIENRHRRAQGWPDEFFETVRILVERGADVNLADNNGKTAVMLAEERGYSDIVDLLN